MGYVVNFNNASNIKAAFIERMPSPGQYAYDLTPLEEQMRDDAVSRLNAVNPNHRYMTFGFITDLHTPGSAAGTGAYYDNTALPSIKLLGSIAHEFGMDAVLVGGDLASGAALDRAQYDAQIDVIKGYFNQYIPCTYYLTDGNHDRKYNSLREMRTNAEWLATLSRFNDYKGRPVTFAKDVAVYDVQGNRITENLPLATYYVDFDEYKVRLASISSYDREGVTNGGASAKGYYLGTYASLMFSGNKRANEWIFGAFTHDNSSSPSEHRRRFNFYSHWLDGAAFIPSDKTPSNWAPGAGLDDHKFDTLNSGIPGKGVIGEISGHIHPSVSRSTYTTGGYTMPVIQTDGALYGSVSKGLENQTLSNYCFSIFVIRTDQMKLYELEVGKHRNEAENGIRVYDIARSQSAPAVSDDTFKFYHISDIHRTTGSVDLCKQLMEEPGNTAAFTIFTGDFATDGYTVAQNQAIKPSLVDFGSTHDFLMVHGNHDSWEGFNMSLVGEFTAACARDFLEGNISGSGVMGNNVVYGTSKYANSRFYDANDLCSDSIHKDADRRTYNGEPMSSYWYKDYSTGTGGILRVIGIDSWQYRNPDTQGFAKYDTVYLNNQVNWFIDRINELGSDDYLLVAMHNPPVTSSENFPDASAVGIRRSNTFCSSRIRSWQSNKGNGNLWPMIINAYTSTQSSDKVLNNVVVYSRNRDTGDSSSQVTVNADFRGNSPCTFLGYLCGHTHADIVCKHPVYDDQLIMCVDCSTARSNEIGDDTDIPYANRVDANGTISHVLVNEVTVDFKARTITINRIGNNKTGAYNNFPAITRDSITLDFNGNVL